MSPFNRMFLIMATFTFFIAAALPARADTVVFTYIGTGNGTYSGGASGTTLTGGTQSNSPSGEQFRELPLGNSTATLTINGLAANSLTTITFNLYGIQSLDGSGPAGGNSSANPDAFTLTANGTTLLNASFANFPGNTQTFNGTTNTGNNLPGTGSTAQNTLGYNFGIQLNDTTYTLSYTAMANSAGSITFIFTGLQNQGQSDESFGIDNIVVRGTLAGGPTPTGTPEPTTMLLLGTGLAGVAAKVSRRRKAGKQ